MTAVLRAIGGALLLAFASGCGEQAAPATPTAIAATATPTSATSMTIVIDHTAPVLGGVVDRALRVLDVERGSSAEEIGIRAGDVVTKVGGAAVSTSADARRSFQQAHEGDHLSVTVRRGGQELVLPFVVRSINRQGTNPPPPTLTPVPANEDYF